MISMKTRIYPTPRQQRFLSRQFESLFLSAHKKAQQLLSSDPDKLQKYLTRAQNVMVPFLESKPGDIRYVYPCVANQGVKRMVRQYQDNHDIVPVFYHGKMSFSIQNFSDKSLFRVVKKRIYLGKDFHIRMTRELRFKEPPFAATFIYQDGKYWVSFLFEKETKPWPKTHKSVGIDLGFKALATCVDSDGKTFNFAPKPFISERNLQKLEHYSRLLSYKREANPGQKPSKRYHQIQRKIRNLFLKTIHRKDYAFYSFAKEMLRKYDIIGLETLDIKQMLQSNHFTAIKYRFLPFYGLALVCEKKSCLAHKQVVQVDRFYPSSQICSCCGFINKQMKDLKIRHWICPTCGASFDRDENAARNILKMSLNSRSRKEGKQDRK